MFCKSYNGALVTGGAGFLGSNLCAALLDSWHHVRCVDDLSSGSMDNIKPLLDRPGFAFDLRDVIKPLDGKPSVIFNLACPASPPQYQIDPIRTLLTSVLGARHVLELAGDRPIPVVMASTSEVYGDPDIHPQPESYVGHVNPIGPRACYDEGKRAAETLFFDYHRKRGTSIKVARIFNTYGPGMRPDDGRVVSNFIVAALRGKPLILYGGGSQTRSFCYVDDLIDGLLRLAFSTPDFVGPVNLGNPAEVTIEELAVLVRELTGSMTPIKMASLPADDPRQRRPDITLARQALAWEPRTSLRVGLTLTIAYFDRLLSAGAIPARP